MLTYILAAGLVASILAVAHFWTRERAAKLDLANAARRHERERTETARAAVRAAVAAFHRKMDVHEDEAMRVMYGVEPARRAT